MDYFKGIPSSKMKAGYRKLCSRLHPDRGGSTAEFQEVKRQYEQWEKHIAGDVRPDDKQPKHTEHRRTDKGYKILVEGTWVFTPEEVEKDSAHWISENYNVFGFSPSWFKQGQIMHIVDREAGECMVVRGVFRLKRVQARFYCTHEQFKQPEWRITVLGDGGVWKVDVPAPRKAKEFFNKYDATVLEVMVPSYSLKLKVFSDRDTYWHIEPSHVLLRIHKDKGTAPFIHSVKNMLSHFKNKLSSVFKLPSK